MKIFKPKFRQKKNSSLSFFLLPLSFFFQFLAILNRIIKSRNKFSIPINNFCYPFGQYNQKVVDVVKSKKYNHAFTTQFGTISENTDPFQIPRIDIWNKDSIGDFNLKIEGKYNWHNNIHFLKKLIN